MSILVVSVSHRSTSVGMLSRLAMDATSTAKLAETLVGSDHIDEAVVLSTCNRTELYTSVSRFHGGLDDTVTALADLAGLTVEELRTICQVYFDEGAVAHTFAVAAGLDSVVLGESQILGQELQILAYHEHRRAEEPGGTRADADALEPEAGGAGPARVAVHPYGDGEGEDA